MIVRVLSKDRFDDKMQRMRIPNDKTIQDDTDKAFISIMNSDLPHSYFPQNYSNVLRLIFDDVTEEENESRVKKGLQEMQLFTIEQAETIIEFIERNINVKEFYVHCLAGVSRSGAVGTFINDVYGEEKYFDFLNENPIIKPNFYILALLRRVYNGY
jgi:predicted protein tyrosine phosphatase